MGGNITKRVVAKGCPEHDTPTPEPHAVRIGHRSDCPHFPHLSLLGKTCTCDYAAVVALVGAAQLFDEAIRHRTIRVLPVGPVQTETGATMKVGHAIALIRDALAALREGGE